MNFFSEMSVERGVERGIERGMERGLERGLERGFCWNRPGKFQELSRNSPTGKRCGKMFSAGKFQEYSSN